MMRQSGARLRTAVLAAAALLAVLAGAEGAGRMFPDLMPEQWQIEDLAIRYPFTVTPDTDLGFAMPPRQHETIRTRDYTFLAETDGNGFPNREPWPVSPTLVLLGDSLVTGIGVGLDDAVSGRLAQIRPHERVVNLGLPAAGPERQARVYRRYGNQWRPAVVISCLFLSSDVENDLHFLAWLESGARTTYNAFRLKRAGADRDKGLAQRVLDHSWLLSSARDGVSRLAGSVNASPRRFRFGDGSEILFERHALEFATAEVSPDDPRIDVFLASTTRLQEAVERTGARFVVALIPSKEELYAVPHAVEGNLAGRLKARLTSAGIPIFDLHPVFAGAGDGRATFFSRDIHLTAHGNRLVADALATRIATERGEP